MFTLIQQCRNPLCIVSWASLCACVGISVGSPARRACQGGAGQECASAHRCVGASVGTLRPLSLDYKSFWVDFAGIKAQEARRCATRDPSLRKDGWRFYSWRRFIPPSWRFIREEDTVEDMRQFLPHGLFYLRGVVVEIGSFGFC